MVRNPNVSGGIRTSVCFVSLAYGLSWAVAVPAALYARGLSHLPVPNGLQTFAQLCPAIAALLTLGWFRLEGIGILWSSIIGVRVSAGWYVYAILLPWGTQLLAMLGYRLLGYVRPVLDPWYQLPLLSVVLALFSLGEEIGWRGLLLPTLLEVTSPMAATAWVALVWGIWHLPFYFARNASGAQTGVDYLLFMVGIFPVSALFTLLYLRTRSVFLCAVLHGALNSGAAYWFGSLNKATFAFGIWVAVLWVGAVSILRFLPADARTTPLIRL